MIDFLITKQTIIVMQTSALGYVKVLYQQLVRLAFMVSGRALLRTATRPERPAPAPPDLFT